MTTTTLDPVADERGPAPHGRQWCAAMSKQRQAPCERLARPGATVCYWHGGKAPQVQRKATERMEAEQLTRDIVAELAEFGVVWEGRTQLEGLHDAFVKACSWTAAVGRRLDEARLVSWSEQGVERLGAVAAEYGAAIDRQARVTKLCIDAGLEIRTAELQERVVSAAAGEFRVLLDGVLAALLGLVCELAPEARAGLEAAWVERVPRIVAAQARAIDGGGS